MAEKDQPKQPSHRAYSVIRREGQYDFWLNLGLAFPHKDGKGFNIVLQALPLDGKIVCREVGDDDRTAEADRRSERGGRDDRPQRRSALAAGEAGDDRHEHPKGRRVLHRRTRAARRRRLSCLAHGHVGR